MSSNSTGKSDLDSADADKVNAAIEAIMAGKLDQAEAILRGVIANTPAAYSHVEQTAEGTTIRFWDQTEFIHYVTWQKSQGKAAANISWIGNAYPRAHYYMGFLCVKRKQFEKAIEFLDRGQRLEPTNPKFNFEKAQAQVGAGKNQEALALYQQVANVGPHVNAHDLAVAQRGQGFVLIELGDLDGAETAFKSSLKIEPDNEVALNELAYIAQLRQGGAPALSETVATTGPNVLKCAACGKEGGPGVVVSLNGMPVSICRRCERKFSKRWWQFWK